ncbi:DHA2 family efflux MFS transporter permease subunit [Paenibacillus nasutitermitis]|uniref:MFS transporter n=1 Tax=Paenibacillus nasutitermitis TaxID=1652958 RepID=A0A917DRE7_9BACL|nr:DHA2 family efflux MFS transporter permease subunit [Paenibacillus nasutitermitis]GGD59859.1 MFS transporter [Paenibacillus nasutitermitis]
MGNNDKRKWWVLAALALGLLTIGLDMTVLNVALPTLATELKSSTSDLQWIANAYTLALAALLLPAGMLGDRYGRKKWLLIAFVVFGVASIGCAYSPTSEMLIAMRILLGLGAAFLIPLSMSALPVLFTGKERTKAMMIWAMANTLGIPLGPIVGGWLLQHYSWGSVFLINIPIVVVALVALAVLMPESRSEQRRRLDLPGILTSSAGIVMVTYGVIRAGERGWDDSLSLLTSVVGVLLISVFILWQRRSRNPIIDLSLFSSKSFTWGTLLATLVTFAIFGLLFVLPQFYQVVMNANPLETGLRLLPLIGGLIVGTKMAERLVSLSGTKMIVSIGCAVMAGGLFLGTATNVESSLWFIYAWITVTGLGFGLALPIAMDSALGVLSAERSGVGSALIMALRQVGGAFGVALLGSAFNYSYRNGLVLSSLPAEFGDAIRQSASAGVAFARQQNSATILDNIQYSFIHGMETMLWICGGIAALGIFLAFVFLPAQSIAAKQSQPMTGIAVSGEKNH